MPGTEQLSVTLPKEMAEMIKSKVASGEYASESEVIWDGLRALSERDLTTENWLRDKVVPSLDRMQADPSRGRTVQQVRDSLSVAHERAAKARKGAM